MTMVSKPTFLGSDSLEATVMGKTVSPFRPLRDDTVMGTGSVAEARVFWRFHAALLVSYGHRV